MKIYLTGGTGFIGCHLVKALLARDWNVTALVRNPNSTQAKNLSKTGVRLVTGDVTKRESMRKTMLGADIVIHNAGHYEFGVNKGGKELMHDINVNGTDNVLGLAHEMRIPKSLYISSVVAFGESTPQEQDETFERQTPCYTNYEQSKTDAHKIAIQYKERRLPLIIVCPSSVIGVNDHSSWGYFLRMYINCIMPPITWSPEAIHGPVDVNDLSEGILLAVEKGCIGETYFFSGEFRTFYEHLSYWRNKPGASKSLFCLPSKLTASLFSFLEPLQRKMNLPAFISRETVIAASMNWHYSSNKAKLELGWTHRPAGAMWSAAIDGELELLSRRKGQSLIERLKPLDIVD